MDEITCPDLGSVIKIQCIEQKESKLELMYNAGDKMMNTLRCVDFVKLFMIIKYSPHSNQKIGKEDNSLPL